MNNLKNRSKTLSAPEIWIPDELASDYAAAYPEVERELSKFTPDVLAPVLGNLDEIAIAAVVRTDFDGIDPRTVQPPALVSVAAVPGRPSSTYQEAVAAQRQQAAVYAAAQEASAELLEKSRALCAEIRLDEDRLWGLRLHVEAISRAIAARDSRAQLEESERARLAIHQCPQCRATDQDRIGVVQLRPLLPGHVLSWERDGVAAIRSCLACWNVKSAQYVAQLAEEHIDDEHTRAQVLGITN